MRSATPRLQYDYWSTIVGNQIAYAGVWLDHQVGPAGPQLVELWDACGFDYALAVCNRDPKHFLDEFPLVEDSIRFDVTNLMRYNQSIYQPNQLFGVAGSEEHNELSFKQFNNAVLVLNIEHPPPAPTQIAPADDRLVIAATQPTLSWTPVVDPDGDPVQYLARIATSADAEFGLVATSPLGTATSWQVPEGALRDGTTYYWAAWSFDGQLWSKSTVRKLTVDRRYGAAAMSPTDEFAGVTTNLVTGNAALSVGGPEMPSVGGGIGVDFAYNSHKSDRGLTGTYREDTNKNGQIDKDDQIRLVRNDASIGFNWALGSPSPGVPVDWFNAQWDGYVALPAGNWQFGARSDDGIRIRIDGNQVLDKWVGRPMPAVPDWQDGTVSGGSVHRIGVDYFEIIKNSAVEVWVRNADNPSQEFLVPPDWFSTSARELPAGWSLEASGLSVEYTRAQVANSTVTLYQPDGSTLAFAKDPLSSNYKPPADVEDVVAVNADGTVTVLSDSGLSYVFRADGKLASVASAADDRKPAATAYGYDDSGRLSTLTDPVSGRAVTLTYAPSDKCADNPPFEGASGFGPAPVGMFCRADYWDGTATELYYKNGLLAYIRNPGDAYWGFGYDTNGRLLQFHDPLMFDVAQGGRPDLDELRTEIAYDDEARATSVTQPAPTEGSPRPARSFSYAPVTDPSGLLDTGTASVTRVGLEGVARTVTYDNQARTTQDANAKGETTKTTWNNDDQVTAVDAPDGLKTTTIYNNLKQPTDSWGPAPASMFNPDGIGQAGVPHSQTRFDEGMDGAQAVWWNNTTAAGTPVAHQAWPGQIYGSFPTGSIPADVNANGISARYSGQIVFPAPGDYTIGICVGPYDKGAVFVDDRQLDNVDASASGLPFSCGPGTVFHATKAGEAYRLRLDYADISGGKLLTLNWKPPGGTSVGVPSDALKPNLGLATSTVDPDGNTAKTIYTDTATGPQHGIPVSSTDDPDGLSLTTKTGYETVGTGYLRTVSTTLPAGDATKTTKTYYGDKEERDNPCTIEDDPANQAGMLKLDTAADPDGDGPTAAIVRETVYDNSGSTVATRTGDEEWTCSSYDARGRVTEAKYPDFGTQPGRTVTYDYNADPDGPEPRPASPLVTSISDPTGSVTTEINFDRQITSYTNNHGDVTTFTYDQAGRELSNNGPTGQITKAYDNVDRLTQLTRNSAILANNLTYDPAGRLTTVTYPSDAANAGNGTTGTFTYDTLGRPAKTTWNGPGGTLITSDEATRRLGGDIVNQIVDGTDHHPGTDFTYDNAGRLTDAWSPGQHLTYDFAATDGCGTLTTAGRNTNRTRQTIDGGATTVYCYDSADRLTSATDPTVGAIEYDSHGNTTKIFGETHDYDSTDRHIATSKDDTHVTYIRDATDRIVARQLNSKTIARYGNTGSGDAPEYTLHPLKSSSLR